MNDISLTECFTESFLAREDSPAITFLRDGRSETGISYLELERDACRMANTFVELGLEKGDRVILFIPKSLIFVVLCFDILECSCLPFLLSYWL